MHFCRRLVIASIQLAFLTVVRPVDAAGPSAVEMMPPQALAGVVIQHPDRLVSQLQEWAEDDNGPAAGLLEQLASKPELAQAKLIYMGLAATVGQGAWSLPEALLGDEIALGFVPRGDQRGPALALILKSKNPALLDRVLTGIYGLTGLVKNGEPDTTRSRLIGEVRVFALGEGEKVLHCRVADSLIISNDGDVLEGIVQRAKKTASDAKESIWTTARAAAPSSACAWSFFDLAAFRGLRGEFPEKLREAAPAFFFGQPYHAIRTGKLAVGWLDLSSSAWKLSVRIDGMTPLASAERGYAGMPTPQVIWDARKLPRYLAETTLNVAWADLFAERETLLTNQGASDVNNFSTTLSNIFGGVDFLHEILPAVGGPTRLILARQDFKDAKIVPSPKLPAFALVVPIKADAIQKMTQRLFSASQSAISILNLDMAQKGQPTFLLDVDRHAGYKFLFTEFGAPDAMSGMQMSPSGSSSASAPAESRSSADETMAQNGAGVRYNFLPAAAVVEGQYVVATSQALLADIIDALAAAKSAGLKAPENLAASLDIDGQSLVTILKDNHRELVINQMLEKSAAKTEATKNIDMFLDVLALANGLSAKSKLADNRYQADLELRWSTTKRAK